MIAAERHRAGVERRRAFDFALGLVALGQDAGLGRCCPEHPDRWLLGHERCWRCADRDRRRRQRQRDAVRRPPDLLLPQRVGRCRLCASTNLEPRRVYWCSQACVDLWTLATSSNAQRWQLVELHGHACWECGETWRPGVRHEWTGLVGPPAPRPVELAVDHVRPLWSLSDVERQQLRWWLPFNLQLLCTTCHAAKTRREAGERAALRRGQLPLLAVAS